MSTSKRCEFCRLELTVDQSRIAAMFLEPCRRRLAVPRLLHGGATPLLMIVFVVLGPTLSAQSVDPQQPPPPQSELSQLSLEQLADLPIDSVFSASMYMQKVTEAPSSVTIVTADEIRGFGHRTLADILRSVRGFYVTYDRNYSYLGVRGFSRPGDYNARVLLLIDGHRLNDNVFGSALLGSEFPLDVELIERIEIIRGPSSSLYGTSAFFAVINVITKRGSTRTDSKHLLRSRPSTRMRAVSATADGSRRVRICSCRAPAFTATGRRALFYPEFDSPATNNGIAEHADRDGARSCSRRVSAEPDAPGAVRNARQASAHRILRNGLRRCAHRYHRNARLPGYLVPAQAPCAWELASRLSYDRYGYDGDYVYESEEARAASRSSTRTSPAECRGGRSSRPADASHDATRWPWARRIRDNIRQDQYNYDLEPSTAPGRSAALPELGRL